MRCSRLRRGLKQTSFVGLGLVSRSLGPNDCSPEDELKHVFFLCPPTLLMHHPSLFGLTNDFRLKYKRLLFPRACW
jgi:hypothetical protein